MDKRSDRGPIERAHQPPERPRVPHEAVISLQHKSDFHTVGAPERIESFFDLVAALLENDQPGTRFPQLTGRFWHIGELRQTDAQPALRELAEIERAFGVMDLDVIDTYLMHTSKKSRSDIGREDASSLAEFFSLESEEGLIETLRHLLSALRDQGGKLNRYEFLGDEAAAVPELAR